MAANNFEGAVDSLLKGMGSFLSSKTVVGDPTKIGDTIIVPLVDVTFGVGAGSSVNDKKNGSGGGMSGKMTPSAVLVIQNGHTKLVNIKNQDTVTKILDMIPDIVERVTNNDVKVDTDEVVDAAFPKEGVKKEVKKEVKEEVKETTEEKPIL